MYTSYLQSGFNGFTTKSHTISVRRDFGLGGVVGLLSMALNDLFTVQKEQMPSESFLLQILRLMQGNKVRI